MAYRDPTFNANILTDLLGTYLTHNSQEREKYYKAEQQANRLEQQANKPIIRNVGTDLVEFNPLDGTSRVVYKGTPKPTKPSYVEVTQPDGSKVLQKKEEGLKTAPPVVEKNEGKTSEREDEILKIIKDNIKRLQDSKISKKDFFGNELKATWDKERDAPKLNWWLSVRKNLPSWIKDNPNSYPVFPEGETAPYTPTKQKTNFWKDK